MPANSHRGIAGYDEEYQLEAVEGSAARLVPE